MSLGTINPFRYRSYYYDSDLALYYLQSRYYDPNTGRFINADGYVSTGIGILGYNMFAYCKNNPVNSVDPTGEYDSTQAARQEHILYMKNQKAHISTPTVITVNYNAVVYDDYNVKKIINSVTYVPPEETQNYYISMLKDSQTNLAVDVTVFAVATVLLFTPCPEVSALLYAYDFD